MSGISAIQALNPGEPWQAFLQAAVNEAEPPPAAAPEAMPDPAQASAPLPVQATAETRPTETPVTQMQRAEAASVVQPMAPVLMQPLSLQNGPQIKPVPLDPRRRGVGRSVRIQRGSLGRVHRLADGSPGPASNGYRSRRRHPNRSRAD